MKKILCAATISVLYAVAIAWAMVSYLDSYGDHKCLTGEWRGEAICPPNRVEVLTDGWIHEDLFVLRKSICAGAGRAYRPDE